MYYTYSNRIRSGILMLDKHLVESTNALKKLCEQFEGVETDMM